MISDDKKWLNRKEVQEIYGFGWRSLEDFVNRGEVRRVQIKANHRRDEGECKNAHCRYSRDDLDHAMDLRSKGKIARAPGAKRGRKGIWQIEL